MSLTHQTDSVYVLPRRTDLHDLIESPVNQLAIISFGFQGGLARKRLQIMCFSRSLLNGEWLFIMLCSAIHVRHRA